MSEALRADPNSDDYVADQVLSSLLKTPPQSFFLYAGAGAGKTRTLVTVLNELRGGCGHRLRLRNQQIAVITYTNAACDEIIQRLGHDRLFDVRTIHSFAWALIEGFDEDIRAWLKVKLAADITKLREEQERGRAGTKAAVDRERSVAVKSERLEQLDQIRRFVYSPDGANREQDALSHTEVIGITSDFLSERPLMQRFLVCRYPILLVDESQDTNKHLVDALMSVEKSFTDRFSLGLIGDSMQRIYNEGRSDLGESVPESWDKPRLQMNHRSPARVVKLINTIRSDADTVRQTCRSDARDGIVRLFVCGSDGADADQIEARVRSRMAELAQDEDWIDLSSVKTLLLEHQMAARRMGFSGLFDPLYRNESYKPSLLKGELGLLTFFTDLVRPLVDAALAKNDFTVASILRKHSPLLDEETFKNAGNEQRQCLRDVKAAVEALLTLWSEGLQPTLGQVLELIASRRLFSIPDALLPFAEPTIGDEGGDNEGEASAALAAVRECLRAPFEQVRAYHAYISQSAGFDTHHGVKGRQFDRVLVVINDAEARGFQYKYNALFNENATSSRSSSGGSGESSRDRLRRLFYVTCSRTKQSLAVVVYSDDSDAVRKHAISKAWFTEDEIESV